MKTNISEDTILESPAIFDRQTNTVKIANREIKVGGPAPKLKTGEKLVKYTSSLCPYCYRLLPAMIFERDNKIYIRRICPEHGEVEEVYYGDAELYYRFERWRRYEGRGPRYVYTKLAAPCPFNCGLCPVHKNHTALANIVLTNRCNLSCWYCFFYAEAAGYVYEPSIEQIRFMIRRLSQQGVTMAVQLTGGEPTLREDLVEIVKMLKEEGVRHVQLNTNGIKFAELYFQDPQKAVEYVRALRNAGVNTVYLSFDGVTGKTNWKNHWEIPFIFDAFRKGGMTSVVLVPTIIRSVNDHELGAIIKFAAKHMDIVRGVNFQPVSLTGMMPKHERDKYRITIPEAIKKIEEQTEGQIHKNAWYPIPVTVPISRFIEALSGEPQFEMANHPHCGAATYVYVQRRNGEPVKFIPVTDFIDVEGFLEYLEEKTEEIKKGKKKFIAIAQILYNLKKFIDDEKAPKEFNVWKLLFNIFVRRNYKALGEWHYHFLFLGMMHFMDLYNYDVARVMRCNIHYLVPDGRLIPFCAFNVLNDIYRDHIQDKYKVPIEEWTKKYGDKSIGEAVKYKRPPIKKLENSQLYIETYKGILPNLS